MKALVIAAGIISISASFAAAARRTTIEEMVDRRHARMRLEDVRKQDRAKEVRERKLAAETSTIDAVSAAARDIRRAISERDDKRSIEAKFRDFARNYREFQCSGSAFFNTVKKFLEVADRLDEIDVFSIIFVGEEKNCFGQWKFPDDILFPPKADEAAAAGETEEEA